jgi:hypothetical protein
VTFCEGRGFRCHQLFCGGAASPFPNSVSFLLSGDRISWLLSLYLDFLHTLLTSLARCLNIYYDVWDVQDPVLLCYQLLMKTLHHGDIYPVGAGDVLFIAVASPRNCVFQPYVCVSLRLTYCAVWLALNLEDHAAWWGLVPGIMNRNLFTYNFWNHTPATIQHCGNFQSRTALLCSETLSLFL